MSFLPAQILLFAVIAAFAAYVLRARSVRNERLILILMALAGAVLVVAPELSTWLANRLGIGRGVDLVIYLFILFCMFRFVGISAQARKTQRQITELVRALALRSPEHGAGPAGGATPPRRSR